MKQECKPDEEKESREQKTGNITRHIRQKKQKVRERSDKTKGRTKNGK